MTPDLIFGIAFAIIALFVLIAMLFHSLQGENTTSVIALFVLLCILILTSATFFGNHVEIVNPEYKIERLQE